MITREEAQDVLDQWLDGKGRSKTHAELLIYELFDQFESQLLSNPLQFTCDGCKCNGSVYEDWSEHCGNCARNVIQEDDMFELKDTK